MKKRVFLQRAAVLPLILFTAPVMAYFSGGAINNIDPAVSGMGASTAVSAEGVGAVFNNPAGLASCEGEGFIGAYGSLVNHKRQFWAFGASLGILRSFTVAAGASSVFSETGSRENVYSVSAAAPLFRDLYAGLSVKLLDVLYGAPARALSADAGIIYYIKDFLAAEKIGFALFISDPASRLRFEGGAEDDIGTKLDAGINYKGAVTAAVSASLRFDLNVNGGTQVMAGVEKEFGPVAARCGAVFYESIGPSVTAGAGLKAGGFIIDYAFMTHEKMGQSHKMGIRFVLPGKPGKRLPPPSALKAHPGDGSAYIKWNSVYGSIDGFRVYVGDDKGTETFTDTAGADEAGFLIRGLENGLVYEVRITAFSGGEESEGSIKVRVEPAKMPEDINRVYKSARVLYIKGSYADALKRLESAGRGADKYAETVMLKERLKKIISAGVGK